jgi:hypothetical protein
LKPSDLILGCLALAFSSVPALSAKAEWRKVPFSEPAASTGLCARGDSLWASFDEGVRASGDGGATWSESGTGFRPGKVASVAAGLRHLAACQGKVLFLSEDGGRTWVPRDSLAVGEFLRMDSWDDTLFAWHTLFAGNAPGGVRISTDDGLTWGPLAIEKPPLPEPRVFASDTFSFANGTLYRVNSDGPKEMHSFDGHILAVAPARDRLFALADGLIFAASDPQGAWTLVRTRNGPASTILGLAADSDRIAVVTPVGVSLSRNRGRDWEFLRVNFTEPHGQSLQLSDSALYLRRSLYDPSPRRYSLSAGTWDSLTLPPTFYYANAVFTAKGDRLAWLSQTGPSGDSIFLDRGHSGRFLFAGIAPQHPTGFVNLLLGRESRMVFVSQNAVLYSWTDGAEWQPRPAVTCNLNANPIFSALGDSGVFLLANNGLVRIPPDANNCNRTQLLVPDANGRLTSTFASPVYGIAATGGRLYLGAGPSLWVWEEPSGEVPIRARPRSNRRASDKARFPVRVWARPGVGSGTTQAGIDARGAVRK